MNNNGGFTGKVVLVTGGTSGIGKVTAIEFARAGAKVVVSGRREKQGEEVVRQIQKLGSDAAFIRADIAKDRKTLRFRVSRLSILGVRASYKIGSWRIRAVARQGELSLNSPKR